jgi:hypothetical protein
LALKFGLKHALNLVMMERVIEKFTVSYRVAVALHQPLPTRSHRPRHIPRSWGTSAHTCQIAIELIGIGKRTGR